MKLYILGILALILFAGCSVKIYQSPRVELTIKDAETNEPIKGVKLGVGVLANQTGAVSNSDGKVEFDGVYERRWHLYPFPIISRGSLVPAYFLISHPDYDRYELHCMFTTLGGSCGPDITNINKKKKELLIECDGCREVKEVAK